MEDFESATGAVDEFSHRQKVCVVVTDPRDLEKKRNVFQMHTGKTVIWNVVAFISQNVIKIRVL